MRRRGDVNAILTHKKGKEWTSFPPRIAVEPVRKALEPKGLGLAAVRVPHRQLSKQVSRRLKQRVHTPEVLSSPG